MKSFPAYLMIITILLFPSFSNASNNFLVISDIHLNPSGGFTMILNPSSPGAGSDLDPTTFPKLISQIKDNIDQGRVARPDFIILLGDLVGHQRSSSQSALTAETSVFSLLKNTFPYPIFYVTGNNDSLVSDYDNFSSTNPARPRNAYDVAEMKSNWTDGFLSTGCKLPSTNYPCLITENTQIGYYSAYIQPKFRLISLNTVLFSADPLRAKFHYPEQPALDELTWLGDQLQQASGSGESVLIVMHIPPGNNVYDDSTFWLGKEQASFLALIKTYNPIITGILASHTHAEELKMIKNTGVGVYFTAALSTSHGNAPSFKTFDYALNNGKWHLTNTWTYNFKGVAANPIFNSLYNYNTLYCNGSVISLSDCFNNVTAEKMKQNNYFSAGNPNFPGTLRFPNDIYINSN